MRTLSSSIIFTLLTSLNLAASGLPTAADASRSLAIGPERLIRRAPQRENPRPAVAWNGSVYLAVWEQPDERFANFTIMGQRLDSAGSPIESPFPIAEGVRPILASDGTDFMLVFIDLYQGLMALQIPREPGPIGPPSVAASFTALGEWMWIDGARIEFGAGVYLVVWGQYGYDEDNGPRVDIRAMRLTSQGVPWEPGGVPLASGGGSHFQPAVVWSGSEFLVVWANRTEECDEVRGCQASAQILGTMLDPSLAFSRPFEVSKPVEESKNATLVDPPIWSFQPKVGWNGEHFLVVWGGWPSNESGTPLYATRLSPNGVSPDGRPSEGGGFMIRGNAELHRVNAVESLDGDFHVIWEEGIYFCRSLCTRPSGPTDGGNLYGAVVSNDGVVGARYSVSAKRALERDADVILRPDGQGIIVYDSDSSVMMRVIGGPAGRTRPVRPRGSVQ